MRPGTYRDKHGDLFTLRRTKTGLIARYADGRVVVLGGNR